MLQAACGTLGEGRSAWLRRNDQPRVTAPDRYVRTATVSDPLIHLPSTRADVDHAEKQSLFEAPSTLPT